MQKIHKKITYKILLWLSWFFSQLFPFQLHKLNWIRGETRALIGGGGEYSYIRVLPDEFLLKLTLMTADFKRNSSGRTRRYEYSPPQLTL